MNGEEEDGDREGRPEYGDRHGKRDFEDHFRGAFGRFKGHPGRGKWDDLDRRSALPPTPPPSEHDRGYGPESRQGKGGEGKAGREGMREHDDEDDDDDERDSPAGYGEGRGEDEDRDDDRDDDRDEDRDEDREEDHEKDRDSLAMKTAMETAMKMRRAALVAAMEVQMKTTRTMMIVVRKALPVTMTATTEGVHWAVCLNEGTAVSYCVCGISYAAMQIHSFWKISASVSGSSEYVK